MPNNINLKTKIEVKNLSAAYNSKNPIINNLSFSLEEGKILSLIGPNGSGKTSLLYLLAQLSVSGFKKTKGEIYIDNKAIEDYTQKEKAKKIAFLRQGETQSWAFTVFETVLMGRYIHSASYLPYSKEDKTIVLEILDTLGMSHLKNANTNKISGGELQKVFIARSLCQNTDILLLDEPFTFLDIEYQSTLIKLIKKIAREKNKTIVLSVHDLNLCPLLSEKILLLDKKNAIFGSIEKVFQPEIFDRVYKTEFGIFEHPVLKIPQVYVKKL